MKLDQDATTNPQYVDKLQILESEEQKPSNQALNANVVHIAKREIAQQQKNLSLNLNDLVEQLGKKSAGIFNQ